QQRGRMQWVPAGQAQPVVMEVSVNSNPLFRRWSWQFLQSESHREWQSGLRQCRRLSETRAWKIPIERKISAGFQTRPTVEPEWTRHRPSAEGFPGHFEF